MSDGHHVRDPSRAEQHRLQLFDSAFNATDDGVLIVDVAGRLVYHNQPFMKIWGLDRALVPGVDDDAGLQAALRQMVAPAEFEALLARLAAAPDMAADALIPLTDGRLFEARSQPQRLRDEVVGRVWWFRDVTERQQMVHALQQSEERFSHLFFASPFSILLATYPEGRIVDVNPAFCRLFERDRDEVVGRTTNEINLWADSADRERMIRHLQAGQPVRGMEFAFTTRAGDRRVVYLSIELVQLHGEWHSLASSVDVTGQKEVEAALRESEVRYRTLFDAIGETIYLVDEDGMFLSMNRAFEETTGWARSEWIARSFAELVHPDDLPAALAMFHRAITGDRPPPMDFRMRHQNGEWLVAECSAVIPLLQDGRIAGFLGTGRDVTRQRRFEEGLRQAQKIEALGTLAGGIAHDFNNILGAVIGHAQLLKGRLAGQPELAWDMNGILEASARAKALVRQILTFSRQHPDERNVVPLAPVVREALGLLRATLPSTITIEASFADPDALILADSSQVHQVIVNLGTNAVHAMRDTGGTLRFVERIVEPDHHQGAWPAGLKRQRHVLLTVTDSGHGMPPAVLRRVFDPFFTTKPPTEGTGLGLAVVDGIMHSHDGEITLDSREGEGTTVSLYFPAVDAAGPVEGGDAGLPPEGRGERIMFVDDEPALVALTTRMLRQLGYDVSGFTDPAAAVAAFLAAPDRFDLILTDLTMPRVTGADLARQVLARRPDIPVLLTSGNVGVLKPEEIQAIGVREVLPKPFELQTLAEAVARHVVRRPA